MDFVFLGNFSLALFIDMDALLQMPNRQSNVKSSNLKIEVKIFQQTERKEDEKDEKKVTNKQKSSERERKRETVEKGTLMKRAARRRLSI